MYNGSGCGVTDSVHTVLNFCQFSFALRVDLINGIKISLLANLTYKRSIPHLFKLYKNHSVKQEGDPWLPRSQVNFTKCQTIPFVMCKITVECQILTLWFGRLSRTPAQSAQSICNPFSSQLVTTFCHAALPSYPDAPRTLWPTH